MEFYVYKILIRDSIESGILNIPSTKIILLLIKNFKKNFSQIFKVWQITCSINCRYTPPSLWLWNLWLWRLSCLLWAICSISIWIIWRILCTCL